MEKFLVEGVIAFRVSSLFYDANGNIYRSQGTILLGARRL